jgi:hypothetical protein
VLDPAAHGEGAGEGALGANCTLGTTGLYWSSATPGDVSAITSFLQTQPGLQNLPPPVVLQPGK